MYFAHLGLGQLPAVWLLKASWNGIQFSPRDNVVIYEGKLESLRRLKNDVAEVRNGTECGIGIKDYNDIKPKDQIEAYVHKEVIVEDDEWSN